MGVAHVVKPARFTDRRVDCGFPETCAEAGATQRPTCRGGEDQAIVSGVGGDVLGEDVDEPRGDRDGASGCAGLGLSVGACRLRRRANVAVSRRSRRSGLRIVLRRTRRSTGSGNASACGVKAAAGLEEGKVLEFFNAPAYTRVSSQLGCQHLDQGGHVGFQVAEVKYALVGISGISELNAPDRINLPHRVLHPLKSSAVAGPEDQVERVAAFIREPEGGGKTEPGVRARRCVGLDGGQSAW